MRKKFLTLCLVLALCLWTTACSAPVTQTAAPETAPESVESPETVESTAEPEASLPEEDTAEPDTAEEAVVDEEKAPDQDPELEEQEQVPAEEPAPEGQEAEEPTEPEKEEPAAPPAEETPDPEEDTSTSWASFYPYYDMLGSNKRSVYQQMYEAALSCNNSVFPTVTLSGSDVHDAFMALHGDHPELFWLEPSYSYGHSGDGIVTEIRLEFNDLHYDLSYNQERFNEAIYALIAGASGSNVDKARYVFNELAARCYYDRNAYYDQSAYSAAVNGQAVCAGYAKTFQYAMQQLGIPCYYCTGISQGEGHAWNIIYLDRYYNVDCSQGDIGSSGDSFYFRATDQEFAGSHSRDGLARYLPSC